MFVAAFAAFLLAAPLSARATALHFSLDTSSLSATAASLAFDFIDGDGVANNTVTISDFSTDGTLGVASTTGGVSITDPPDGPFPVTLADTDFFSEFLQELTLGSALSFTLTLTQQWDSGGLLFDSFAFFLLDATATSPLFATTDPTGAGALFAVDIDGSHGGVLYHFAPVDTDLAVIWTVERIAARAVAPTKLLMVRGCCAGWRRGVG